MLEAKNKFICEKKLLLSLSDKTKFLENKEISKNAQKIIDLCRKNRIDRTKLDAFLNEYGLDNNCLLYTSPSPRDLWISRMPSSA